MVLQHFAKPKHCIRLTWSDLKAVGRPGMGTRTPQADLANSKMAMNCISMN
jgi:hypothetical protein